jgi:nitrous oxide reductase accessory protein NosL
VVNHFEKPNEFIEATKANFIVSSKFQSPMMGNCAAFSDENKEENMLKNDAETKRFTWIELTQHYK